LIYKLKRQSDFDKLFKKGKKCYAKSLMMLYFPSDSLKIGYSISKKHGKAVKRNRIKRLLRAAVREVFKDSECKVYIVIVPRVKEEYLYKEYLGDIAYLKKKENLK
jgi:ribonuclease P protein component